MCFKPPHKHNVVPDIVPTPAGKGGIVCDPAEGEGFLLTAIHKQQISQFAQVLSIGSAMKRAFFDQLFAKG